MMPTTHAYNLDLQSRPTGNQRIGSFRTTIAGRSALPAPAGCEQSKLSTYFYVQIASAFIAALAAAQVLYEDVPTSFILAFVGKNSDGYCDNFSSLMEHLCEAMFCTTWNSTLAARAGVTNKARIMPKSAHLKRGFVSRALMCRH
jgi:hypothetical protein